MNISCDFEVNNRIYVTLKSAKSPPLTELEFNSKTFQFKRLGFGNTDNDLYSSCYRFMKYIHFFYSFQQESDSGYTKWKRILASK